MDSRGWAQGTHVIVRLDKPALTHQSHYQSSLTHTCMEQQKGSDPAAFACIANFGGVV